MTPDNDKKETFLINIFNIRKISFVAFCIIIIMYYYHNRNTIGWEQYNGLIVHALVPAFVILTISFVILRGF